MPVLIDAWLVADADFPRFWRADVTRLDTDAVLYTSPSYTTEASALLDAEEWCVRHGFPAPTEELPT